METDTSELPVKILTSLLFSERAIICRLDDILRCFFHSTDRKSVTLLFPVYMIQLSK